MIVHLIKIGNIGVHVPHSDSKIIILDYYLRRIQIHLDGL